MLRDIVKYDFNYEFLRQNHKKSSLKRVSVFDMHEMGIAMQIIEIASSSIPEELAGTPIKHVNLRIGKLSAVVPSSLSFCFEIASKDTPLEGAKLKVEEVPVEAMCNECNNKFTIENTEFSCPKCKSGDLEILAGRELDIASIEIAEDN